MTRKDKDTRTRTPVAFESFRRWSLTSGELSSTSAKAALW